jgi:hypothetical protein
MVLAESTQVFDTHPIHVVQECQWYAGVQNACSRFAAHRKFEPLGSETRTRMACQKRNRRIVPAFYHGGGKGLMQGGFPRAGGFYILCRELFAGGLDDKT